MIGLDQQRKSHTSSRSLGRWVWAHFPEQRLVIEPRLTLALEILASILKNYRWLLEKCWLKSQRGPVSLWNILNNKWLVPKETAKFCFPRDQSSSDLSYSPQRNFFVYKFMKINLASGQHLPWRHRFCSVTRSEILAGTSFIVRYHVTSK